MFRDSVITVQKNFDHYYRSGTRLLVQRVKSHKLTSNACHVTFFRSNLMHSQSHYLRQLYVINSIVILFKATTGINILKKIAKLNSLSIYQIYRTLVSMKLLDIAGL